MIGQICVPPMESIHLGPGLNVLGMHHPSIFFQYSQLLKGNQEIGNVYDEEGNLMEKLNSRVLFIGDIAGIYSYDEWFIKQAVLKVLTNLDETHLKELHEIYEKGYSVFDTVALEGMLPVRLTAEFDTKSILGIYKPIIDVPSSQNFYDVIQSVIDTAGALNEKRMLVLLHITKYCTDEQINYLTTDILRQNLQVLSLEWTDHLFRFDNGRSWYIDEDFEQFS